MDDKILLEKFNIKNDINKLVKIIKDLENGKIKNNFYFEKSQKFKYVDVKTDSNEIYDNVLFDIIFNNNIHTKLEKLFKKPMYLFDIQIRYVNKNKYEKLGYFGWHRDTCYNIEKNKIKGMMPTAYKMIIYPKTNELEYECFKIIPDSFVNYKNKGYNISDHDNSKYPPKKAVGNRIDPKLQKFINKSNKITLFNSNKYATLFDSSLIHTAINPPRKQFRIIYWFSSLEDYNYNKDNIVITRANKKILEIYKNRLQDLNNNKLLEYQKNLYLLNRFGFFYKPNFIKNKNILEDISNKVIKIVNTIDKNITKEYDDYYVESVDNCKEGSISLNNRCKTTFNFRGKAKDKKNGSFYYYDTGFCDITRADLLFDSINKLDLEFIYNQCSLIKKDFDKDKDLRYHIYYTDSVVDTRTWHWDGNVIKFFIYCTDVNLEEGPYAYIANSNDQKIPTDINRDIDEQNLNNIINSSKKYKKFIFIDKKGSLICSNQRGIHRGYPQKIGKCRIMIAIRLFNL